MYGRLYKSTKKDQQSVIFGCGMPLRGEARASPRKAFATRSLDNVRRSPKMPGSTRWCSNNARPWTPVPHLDPFTGGVEDFFYKTGGVGETLAASSKDQANGAFRKRFRCGKAFDEEKNASGKRSKPNETGPQTGSFLLSLTFAASSRYFRWHWRKRAFGASCDAQLIGPLPHGWSLFAPDASAERVDLLLAACLVQKNAHGHIGCLVPSWHLTMVFFDHQS